jgi:hypothetical protein
MSRVAIARRSLNGCAGAAAVPTDGPTVGAGRRGERGPGITLAEAARPMPRGPAYLKARLEALAERRQLNGAVHGSGLYLSVEFARDRGTVELTARETAATCDGLLESWPVRNKRS